jgi:hypothetical protein
MADYWEHDNVLSWYYSRQLNRILPKQSDFQWHDLRTKFGESPFSSVSSIDLVLEL